MTSDEFAMELYRDFDWRFDEVRRFQYLVDSQESTLKSDELRKSLVLVLYAHFEGFCVFSLEHYLAAINRAKLSCRISSPAVVAGAWELLFKAMQHGDEKCEVFRNSLPHDEGLHRHWRRRHFIEELDRLLDLPVTLPEKVIDTESNLKPSVLKRNLFLLGLDYQFVEPHADDIQNLLKRRNNIAHGDQRRGVPKSEYKEFDDAVFIICYRLIDFMTESFHGAKFLRVQPEYQV
jgi:hypothetical protein